MLIKLTLLGAILPVAASVLLCALLGWLRRRGATALAEQACFTDWLGTVPIGVSVGITYLALNGWAGILPKQSWQWLLHGLVWATLMGATFCHPKVSLLLRGIIGILASGVAAWLVVPAWQEPVAIWILSLGVGVLLLWIVLDRTTRCGAGGAIPAVLLLSAVAGGVVLERAGIARFAQMSGMLAAASGGCLVGSRWFDRRCVDSGVVVVGGFFLPALMLIGHLNHFSEVPGTAFLLVAIAPFFAVLGLLGPVKRLPSLKRAAVQLLAVGAPAAVAVTLAVLAAAAEAEGGY